MLTETKKRDVETNQNKLENDIKYFKIATLGKKELKMDNFDSFLKWVTQH